MFGFGPFEIGLVLAVVIILFGAKRLPEIGRSAGETIRHLRGAARDLTDLED